ncbi:beta-1,3-galactosyltransferase 5 [Harpegnathos saltator]|uniref:Hexosyltransferase n=1 Tax=Harpegnathos saltator TaxID=610380 RepID=E2BU61_HARSA|nr:beta-1,3-galactosyltransferase 5 [Harpegnathos saltator]EFN80778.1 Beta-1,3-galactosyltransferase 5 [Harpegnathos saltator]
MLPKLGFLLLFICIACVLFVVFTEKDLRSQKKNIVSSQATIKVTGKSSGNIKLIFKPLCNATLLAWIVTSYAGNPSARSALRRAYTNEELQTLGIRRVFLLGMLDNNTERKSHVSQNALLDESRRFNDILQGDFVDAYRNLTYKHLMGLRWAVNNCKHVQYIIKMDDDIVINIYDILDKLHDIVDENSLTGYALKNMIPVRVVVNKWYVNEIEYADNTYPDFVSGWMYIAHPKIASRLIDYAESSNKYFWIDDVFVTGILRQALNIKIQDISELYTTDYRYLECCMKGRKSLLKCEFLVGPNGGDIEMQVKFKKFAQFCHINCSIRAKTNLVSKTCVTAYKEPNLHEGIVQINNISIL